MDENIKKILEKIEESGFKAYIVGGYVRDKLLNIETNDVDIITDALPKDLIKIFNEAKINDEEYGSVKILTNKYNFDINTYRIEFYQNKRRPEKIEYTKDIKKDLLRRDFTINTMYMDKNGKIYDELNGLSDLQGKVIKSVLDPSIKFKEDPLRMLRAIRFATTLNFQLDKNIIKNIKKYKKLIKSLPYELKKKELNLIFSSKHVKKGLDYLKKLDLLKYMEINYKKIEYVDDLYGIWAQMEFSDKYNFSKQSLYNINCIKKILQNKKIDNKILFEYGLYLSSVAGIILKYDREEISKMYQTLPIKTTNDLKLTVDEIITILNIKPSSLIKEIQNDLISLILCGKIENNKEILKDYIIRHWRNEK